MFILNVFEIAYAKTRARTGMWFAETRARTDTRFAALDAQRLFSSYKISQQSGKAKIFDF
jgi:hypothetical protein